MIRIKIFISSFLLIITVFDNTIQAQDINFSQFYGAKGLFNPGFISQRACNQILFYAKNQAYEYGGFKTVMLHVSNFFPNFYSGYAILIENELEPQNILNYLKISAAYVFRVPLGRIDVSAWLAGQYGNLHINVNRVILPSMLEPFTGQVAASVNLNVPGRRWNTMLNFGYLVYNKYFFFGQSFIGFAQLNWLLDIKPQLRSLGGINLSSGLSVYTLIANLQEFNLGFSYKLNHWWASVAGGYELSGVKKLNTTVGFELGHSQFSVGYSILWDKILISAYELGVKFRFRCKNQKARAIICPAYQL